MTLPCRNPFLLGAGRDVFLAKTKASGVRLCKAIPFKQLEREGSLRGEFEQPGRHED